DDLFWASRLAQAALHAVLLDEAEPRPLGIVNQRACGTGSDAGLAHSAAAGVDLHGAEGCSLRQRENIDRVRRLLMKVLESKKGARALSAHRQEAAGRRP